MCPVIKELKTRRNLDVKIVVTGQHRSMLDDVLRENGIIPDYDLSIMKVGQTLTYITYEVLLKVESVIRELLPDAVLVHGDTSSAFSAALVAFYNHIPIFHIEAGLRTYDMMNPYPEEFNRRAISLVASYHFAPTETARDNLIKEGIKSEKIFVTGNTVIDALIENLRDDFEHPLLPRGNDKLIILTVHRRENLNGNLERIFSAVKKIAEQFPFVKIIYPIHKNERIRAAAKKVFSGVENIEITEPMCASVFHNLLRKCCFVITDSGGIQEEASFLGKPIILVRKCTERKELLTFIGLKVLSDNEFEIFREAEKLLIDREFYQKRATASEIFGDGHASKKIADIIEFALDIKN